VEHKPHVYLWGEAFHSVLSHEQASEGTLVYFASYLARTVRHGTIKTYLAAVRNLQIISSYKDPLRGRLLLKNILRRILRYQGSPRIRRQPVTPGVLLSIHPILRSWLGLRNFSMTWAAFTLAFFAFLRCSEFAYPEVHSFSSKFNLTKECVTFCPSLRLACPQRLLVTLKSSKTDSFRAGQSLIVARCPSLLCPVSAMQQYSVLAKPRSGPLSYFCRYLTRSSVTHEFQDSARSAGLPQESLKGHSFRRGAAPAAAATCLPDWLIKVSGRWSSDCYQIFIRTPESVLLSAAPKMASVSGNFL